MYENKKELKNEEVYRALRNMIALQRFEPGFSLNVQKLSKSLGVSRTPMWEAMRKLEATGGNRDNPQPRRVHGEGLL